MRDEIGYGPGGPYHSHAAWLPTSLCFRLRVIAGLEHAGRDRGRAGRPVPPSRSMVANVALRSPQGDGWAGTCGTRSGTGREARTTLWPVPRIGPYHALICFPAVDRSSVITAALLESLHLPHWSDGDRNRCDGRSAVRDRDQANGEWSR
jgi:hypothetical protein